MLILAIDTSGRQGSVALVIEKARNKTNDAVPEKAHELETLGLTHLDGGRCSEQLVPAIAELLARKGLQKSSIELIAVASGPGSFTGLRVAIATAKGLAEAFAIPVVAVSALEAIALAAATEGPLITSLDAQRSEIFFGEYNVTSQTAQMQREGVVPIAAFTASVAARPQTVFTPDAALAARLRESGVNAHVLTSPNAEDFARIAYRKFLNGIRHNVESLDANYLRRSDAEIFSAPKLGITSR